MKRSDDSKALNEVWQLKEDAYKSVEGIPLAAALHARLTTSITTATQLGFATTRESAGGRLIPELKTGAMSSFQVSFEPDSLNHPR